MSPTKTKKCHGMWGSLRTTCSKSRRQMCGWSSSQLLQSSSKIPVLSKTLLPTEMLWHMQKTERGKLNKWSRLVQRPPCGCECNPFTCASKPEVYALKNAKVMRLEMTWEWEVEYERSKFLETIEWVWLEKKEVKGYLSKSLWKW